MLSFVIALAPDATPHGAPFPPPEPPLPPAPAPPAPRTPGGPAVPQGPTTPTGPSQPPKPATGSGATAMTGGAGSALDPASWEFWWQFNQDRFLSLKAHIDALEVRTSGDTDWLGGANAGGAPTADMISMRVIPALLGVFETERSNDLLTAATIALARSADGPLAARAAEFSRAFQPFTSDPNQEVAETAVLGRGLVGDSGSVFDLVALLDDTEAARAKLGGKSVPERTRTFAAYALGLSAAQTKNEDVRRFVVHHLVNTLHKERGATSDVHVACVIALGLTPLAWADASTKNAADSDAAESSASSIASASRQTQIEALLAILADAKGDRFVRAHAPGSLAKLSEGADDTACAQIVEALLSPLAQNTSEKDEVVQGCVLALGRVAGVDIEVLDTRVRTVLQRIATSSERQTRAFASMSLSQRAARMSNADRAAEVRAFLAKQLAEGRSNERAWAALALGVLEHGRPAGTEANEASVRAGLVTGLKECGSPEELGALAIACGLAGEVAAVPILLDRLEHASEARVQGHLAVALGLIGDTRGSAPLKVLLANARFRPELLRQVAIGLALLEDRTLVPALLETLEKANSLASQAAAASVIGWIGDYRALQSLLSLLANREVTASARGFAAVALGRICDRDRLPWNASITEDIQYRAAPATLIAGDGTGVLEIL